MDLNDLLQDVEGIGVDAYIPSNAQAAPPPADVPAVKDTGAMVVTSQPEPVSEDAFSLPEDEPVTPEPSAAQFGALDRVVDVEVEVLVELGDTRLPLREVMQMQPGDAFTLAQSPGDLLKLYVRDQLIALGEPLVVDGTLAVKIVQLLPQEGTR